MEEIIKKIKELPYNQNLNSQRIIEKTQQIQISLKDKQRLKIMLQTL